MTLLSYSLILKAHLPPLPIPSAVKELLIIIETGN